MASSTDTAFTQQNNEMKIEEDDRISQLPEEIKGLILSLLPFKEAVKTSILSRRWVNLWESAVTELDFDASKMSQMIYNDPQLTQQKRAEFREWVSRFMARLLNNDASTISKQQLTKFRVSLYLTSRFNDDIDTWVKIAMSKRVESLELSFLADYGQHCVFPSLNHIKTPTGLSDIRCLRCLRLSRVDVDDKTIRHFISNCPYLEELAVAYSDLLVNPSIAAAAATGSSSLSSLALKRLEVRQCMHLASLEIADVPCLTHLTLLEMEFKHPSVELRMKECASLVDLKIFFHYREPDATFDFVSWHAAQLLALTMKIHAEYLWMFSDAVEFTRLELLAVQLAGGFEASLISLVPLINACLRLHTLRLWIVGLAGERSAMSGQSVDRVSRESIEVVEITGFRDYAGHSEFVEYVLECFVRVKKIVIKLYSPLNEVSKRHALLLKSKAAPAIDFVAT